MWSYSSIKKKKKNSITHCSSFPRFSLSLLLAFFFFCLNQRMKIFRRTWAMNECTIVQIKRNQSYLQGWRAGQIHPVARYHRRLLAMKEQKWFWWQFWRNVDKKHNDKMSLDSSCQSLSQHICKGKWSYIDIINQRKKIEWSMFLVFCNSTVLQCCREQKLLFFELLSTETCFTPLESENWSRGSVKNWTSVPLSPWGTSRNVGLPSSPS